MTYNSTITWYSKTTVPRFPRQMDRPRFFKSSEEMQPCIALLLFPRTLKLACLRNVFLRIEGECFASNFDVHAPWFDMFGQLFMDEELACNPSLQDQIPRTQNITTTCRDVLASLVPSKCNGLVPWPTFEQQRLLSRSMVPRANPTHPKNPTHTLRGLLRTSLATIP